MLREIKRSKPKLPVLVLSMHPENQFAVRVLKARRLRLYDQGKRARGELVGAIKKVLAGGRYVSPSLAEKLATYLSSDAQKPPQELLSDREFQVLRLIASGKIVSEIAKELSLERQNHQHLPHAHPGKNGTEEQRRADALRHAASVGGVGPRRSWTAPVLWRFGNCSSSRKRQRTGAVQNLVRAHKVSHVDKIEKNVAPGLRRKGTRLECNGKLKREFRDLICWQNMVNRLTEHTSEKNVWRLLRRRGTQEYFKDDGWTSDPAEARAFSDVVEAAEICARHGLTDVELILRVDVAASDVFCTPMR